MRDQTIESLPMEEKDAAQYHVEWLACELGDRQAAEELMTQVLIKMGPQKIGDRNP